MRRPSCTLHFFGVPRAALSCGQSAFAWTMRSYPSTRITVFLSRWSQRASSWVLCMQAGARKARSTPIAIFFIKVFLPWRDYPLPEATCRDSRIRASGLQDIVQRRREERDLACGGGTGGGVEVPAEVERLRPERVRVGPLE